MCDLLLHLPIGLFSNEAVHRHGTKQGRKRISRPCRLLLEDHTIRRIFRTVQVHVNSNNHSFRFRGFIPSLQYIFLYRGAYYGLFDISKALVIDRGYGSGDNLTFLMAFSIGQVINLLSLLWLYKSEFNVR